MAVFLTNGYLVYVSDVIRIINLSDSKHTTINTNILALSKSGNLPTEVSCWDTNVVVRTKDTLYDIINKTSVDISMYDDVVLSKDSSTYCAISAGLELSEIRSIDNDDIILALPNVHRVLRLNKKYCDVAIDDTIYRINIASSYRCVIGILPKYSTLTKKIVLKGSVAQVGKTIYDIDHNELLTALDSEDSGWDTVIIDNDIYIIIAKHIPSVIKYSPSDDVVSTSSPGEYSHSGKLVYLGKENLSIDTMVMDYRRVLAIDNEITVI